MSSVVQGKNFIETETNAPGIIISFFSLANSEAERD